MSSDQSFTLSEIARRLDVPQHRLIHLCEKGVIVPEVHGAAGRGSSRVFSSGNARNGITYSQAFSQAWVMIGKRAPHRAKATA